MKHLKIYLTSIVLLALITSCSQETDVIITDDAIQNEHHISVVESQKRLISILNGMENGETRGTSLFAQKSITSVNFAKEFTETSISDIITGLSQRKVAIFQDIETYNKPNRNHKTVLADNVMYFDDIPEIKYFKINYGKEGAGNGYYLATGFVGKVMYRQPRKVTQ